MKLIYFASGEQVILAPVSVFYDHQFASLLIVGWRIIQVEVSRCVHKKKH